MRNSIIISLLSVLFGFNSLAQSGNEILVGPDYREGENGLVIKWIPEKLIYPEGFNIYRKTENSSNWQKLNTEPLVLSPKPADYDQLPGEIQGIYDFVQQASFQELQDNKLVRAFLKLNLYRTQQMAELLGMIWYDEEATDAIRYQYRVTGLAVGSEEAIGVSEWVTGGQNFKPLPPPDSILVERLEDVINIRWDIDEAISVATQVEKALDDEPFTPIGTLPLYVAFNTDEEGNAVYPEYYIIDNAHPDTTYRYRFALVDKFGQRGEFSEVFTKKPVDLTPPPVPDSPSLVVIDTAMQIDLTWQYTNQPEDLKGFLVYARKSVDDNPMVVSDTIAVGLEQTSVRMDKTGDYLITVAALDNAGNIAESIPMQAKIDDLMAPEPPENITVMQEEGVYAISWEQSTSKDVNGYFLYRYFGEEKPENTNDFKIINGKPWSSNTYPDSLGQQLEGTVWYAVAAVDSSFNISVPSSPASYQIPDNIPPARPFLKAPEITDDGIRLHWMANVDEDLDSWLLIRLSDEDSTGFSLSPDNTEYLDAEAMPGVAYTYRLMARDLTGNESLPSEPISVLASGVDERIFEGILPTNINIKYTKKEKEIQLNWTQVFNSDNLGVVVYKGLSADDLRPYSGKLKTTGFSDKRVKEDTTYFYQLRTYASNGLKKISATQSITIKASDR